MRSSLATEADGRSQSRFFPASRRLRRTSLLVLALALPAQSAAAQVSNNQVIAAYCLGVFDQRLTDGLANGLGEEAARRQAQPMAGLYQYLKVSIGTKTTAPWTALSAVMESGSLDHSECMAGIEEKFTAAPAQCLERCLAPIQDYDLCISCVPADVEPEACKRVLRCKLPPLPHSGAAALAERTAPTQTPKPAPTAVQPQRQPVPLAPSSSKSQSQQQTATVPVSPRPDARPLPLPPRVAAGQVALNDGQPRPEGQGQCTVSRPKPGYQVYLVTCANSWAMIGRTLDSPSSWTMSEGDNATEAVEYFMKSRYAR